MRVFQVFPITAAVIAGTLLAGCNPRYQTFTSYTPPTDIAGRHCLAECSSTRQTCRQSGQALIQQCRSQVQMEAHLETVRRAAAYSIDLERYGNKGHGAPELPGPASPNYARCDYEADGVEQQCRDDYDLCYQNCGGLVEYTTHLRRELRLSSAFPIKLLGMAAATIKTRCRPPATSAPQPLDGPGRNRQHDGTVAPRDGCRSAKRRPPHVNTA